MNGESNSSPAAKRYPENYVGQKFNRLLTISVFIKIDVRGAPIKMFHCQCDCGNSSEHAAYLVMSGRARSCGCYAKEARLKSNTSHKMCGTRQWRCWSNMKGRCTNPKTPSWHSYGGRGITFQESWSSFEGFWNDMGQSYSDDLQLDRVDCDGNYSKENCRWVPAMANSWNKRPRGGSCKYIGVSWHERAGKWQVAIMSNHIKHTLGLFEDPVSAALCYDAKCLELRGDLAVLNVNKFPEDFVDA